MVSGRVAYLIEVQVNAMCDVETLRADIGGAWSVTPQQAVE